MNPIDTQKTTTMAASFGTNVNVISCTLVSAWNKPTATPDNKAAARIGVDTMTDIQSP